MQGSHKKPSRHTFRSFSSFFPLYSLSNPSINSSILSLNSFHTLRSFPPYFPLYSFSSPSVHFPQTFPSIPLHTLPFISLILSPLFLFIFYRSFSQYFPLFIPFRYFLPFFPLYYFSYLSVHFIHAFSSIPALKLISLHTKIYKILDLNIYTSYH